MNLDGKLDFWIKHRLNVLFTGRSGCGKSSIILKAFERANLKYMYFSAATMDVFTDFIGIPKEKIDPKTKKVYLDFLRPKVFEDDEVEAIFIDEFNRGKLKTKNSIMELIQFKAINGRKFNNLKIVWAAINPHDSDQKYDVEELDVAQRDRFHVQIELPYLPDQEYFQSKFGTDVANVALMWWKELDSKVKNEVSPRRLDYALQMHAIDGDLRDVLPVSSNVNKLLLELSQGSFTVQLAKLAQTRQIEAAKIFLKIENNYAACIDTILSSGYYFKFFLPLLPDEKMVSLIYAHKHIEKYVAANLEVFQEPVRQLCASTNSQNKVVQRMSFALNNFDAIKQASVSSCGKIPRHFTSTPAKDFFAKAKFNSSGTAAGRNTNYELMAENLPEKMSIAEAQTSLTFLLDILDRSNRTTLFNKFQKLILMINHVLILLIESKTQPSLSARHFRKLKFYPAFANKIDKHIFSSAVLLATPPVVGGSAGP